MILRPPRSTLPDTLFPYTTLFRSAVRVAFPSSRTIALSAPNPKFSYRARLSGRQHAGQPRFEQSELVRARQALRHRRTAVHALGGEPGEEGGDPALVGRRESEPVTRDQAARIGPLLAERNTRPESGRAT